LFSDALLEPGDDAHGNDHHRHAQRRSQHGKPDDERRKSAFLPDQVSARYKKREVQSGIFKVSANLSGKVGKYHGLGGLKGFHGLKMSESRIRRMPRITQISICGIL